MACVRGSHRHGVDIEQVTLGNGSNDVLVLLAEAFLVPGVEAVHSQYAFAVYPGAVQASGATARVAPAWPPTTRNRSATTPWRSSPPSGRGRA